MGWQFGPWSCRHLKGMSMNAQQRISLGSALATLAGTGITLLAIFGWTSLGQPWSFLVGFVLGVAAGVGVVLAIAGLLECRQSK